MYYAHFGLKQPPFKITPNTEFFFSGGNRGAILDALIYAVTSGEGIVKVVGEVGSGKTMLCRMLQTLLPENVESVYLANPSVAPEDILHAIAFELQLKLPKNADRLQVMQVLQSYLVERHASRRQVVIFVEEAQGMPLATLEEIRLLSNLETKHDKLLQIVLFGQPELDVNLNETQIRQLRERITHSFNLGPLEENEIGEYLIFRLRAAGYYGPHLFSKSAIRKLSVATKGLVRRVNILADKSLLAAFADNVYQATPKHVNIAIKDSEFGAEQARLPDKHRIYLMALATLLAGLAMGFILKQQLGNDAEPPVAKPHANALKALGSAPADKVEVQASTSVVSPAQPAVSDAINAATGQTIVIDILQRRLEVTQNWLNQQPLSTVTIQFMGGGDDAQMRTQLEELARQIELDNIYVFRTKVNGRAFLSAAYGSYTNRDEAVRALQTLPKIVRANRPQLRTIGGIQQEIK
jgi:type II secretory pathway predicted ATPase ExeA